MRVSVSFAFLRVIGAVLLTCWSYCANRCCSNGAPTSYSDLYEGVPVDNDRIKGIRSFLVDAELALIQNKTSTLAGQGRDISNIHYDDRAVVVDEIADMYKNKGDYSGAIWFYTEALDLRRKKAQTLSAGARKACESVDIARTICNIAQMRSLRREFEAASILFDEVKHIYHSVRLPKDHPFYKEYLTQLNVMRKM